MPVPILKQGDVLIVSLQSELADDELERLSSKLSDRVGSDRVTGVVIDVAALDVMDSYATRMFRTMAQVTQLRGATTVMVGIQPDVAVAMVQMGLDLEGAMTALDLEDGLDVLRRDHERSGV